MRGYSGWSKFPDPVSADRIGPNMLADLTALRNVSIATMPPWHRELKWSACFAIPRDHRPANRIASTIASAPLLRPSVQFQPMADEFVAKLSRDLGLQPLDLGAAELDHLAGLRIDEMIVMLA